MRLFLSSQDFGNYPEELVKLIGANKKVAFIANAQDDQPDYRDSTLPEKVAEFKAIGLHAENLDLSDYFGQADKLENKIKDYGLVWCRGGNTFILRRSMAASGLDKILQKLVPGDKLAYGGSSAGSCVVAKSLHGIDKGDRPNPENVPPNYPDKNVIWGGLGFVDFMIVPHCGSDWFGAEADACIEYLQTHHLTYKALRDGQVYIIDGERQELLI